MTKVEFTHALQFGDQTITEINVQPLTFATLVALWTSVANDLRGKQQGSSVSLLQRKRIVHQVHFMAGDKRAIPDASNVSQLPIPVAKAIIATLDIGEGIAGEIVQDGDGVSTPILYKLGNPIEIDSNGKKTKIAELEFKATIYGDIEDVLAVDGDVPQGLELIRKVAVPVETSLKTLPSWAIDRISVADGVTITQKILPRFLD